MAKDPLSFYPQPTQGTGGTYGEGQVSDIFNQLQALKGQVSAGNLSITDYLDQSDKLVQSAANLTGQIAGKGGKAASAVNPIWQQIQNSGFVTAKGGKWVTQLPFSRTEYAKLPDNVLPSQTDVQKGFFDPSLAPMERYQQPTAPTNPSSPSAPQVLPPINPSTPATPPTQIPTSNGTSVTVPALNPSPTPPPPDSITTPKQGIDTRTDQGQLEAEGARQANELAQVVAQQKQIREDALGRAREQALAIPQNYITQGKSSQEQINALADQQATSRAQSLKDLSTTLATNQMNLFNRAIPDLAEQANTSGILPSTGFGNLLANKYNQLTQDTQSQLALKGISDRDAQLQAQQQALLANLGYQDQSVGAANNIAQQYAQQGYGIADQYAGGLADVANTKLGFQTSGLQRSFSLDDYAKQVADMAKYGSAPTAPSSKTGAGIGAVGGATIGGFLGGPTGATAGASAGATAGSGIKK